MGRKRSTQTAVGGNEYRKARGLSAITVMLTDEERRELQHKAIDANCRGPGPYLRMLAGFPATPAKGEGK